MKKYLVACLAVVAILCIGADRPSRYFETSVISSPGNERKTLLLCADQGVKDAVADHLLEAGIHSASFEPVRSEFDNLLSHLCGLIFSEDPDMRKRCEADRAPSPFRSEKHKFTTVNFGDPADMTDFVSYKVYLREGYRAEQQAECVCTRHGCDDQALAAVVQYLSNVIAGL